MDLLVSHLPGATILHDGPVYAADMDCPGDVTLHLRAAETPLAAQDAVAITAVPSPRAVDRAGVRTRALADQQHLTVTLT